MTGKASEPLSLSHFAQSDSVTVCVSELAPKLEKILNYYMKWGVAAERVAAWLVGFEMPGGDGGVRLEGHGLTVVGHTGSIGIQNKFRKSKKQQKRVRQVVHLRSAGVQRVRQYRSQSQSRPTEIFIPRLQPVTSDSCTCRCS